MRCYSYLRRHFAGTGLVVSVIGLVLALGGIVSACGTAGDSDDGVAGEGSTAVGAAPSPPPIDVAAPTSFETASFAFG